MSFGENLLKKYGWSEGKGLGREENGISTFIKPKLKFDSSGVGHDQAEEFTFHWWDHVYNKAANNMSIKRSKTGAVEIVKEEEIKISTKKSSLKNKEVNPSKYGNFVKGCVIEGNKIIEEMNSFSNKKEEKSLELIKNYTDEELFKMNGGLTAHKGARHGLTMSAKLARLEEQEKKFLEKFSTNENLKKKRKWSDEFVTYGNENKISDVEEEEKNVKKKKKKKKHKEKINSVEFIPVVSEDNCSAPNNPEPLSLQQELKKKKKKKKKKKENINESEK